MTFRFTSGVTPAGCIDVASMAAKPFLIHIPVDIFASFCDGSGLKLTTVCVACSKHDAVYHSPTPVRLSA